MPKQIYGHNAPVVRRQSSSSTEELAGYLTLAPARTAAAERTRLAAAELAVADVLLEVDDAMRAAAAPSLIEYAVASKPAALPAWRAVVGECLDDLLGDHSDDDALALVHALRRRGVVKAQPPPPPPLAVGAAVWAVLDEDAEWHEATVEAVGDGLSRATRDVTVRFSEWAKAQRTPRAQVVAVAAAVEDDDESCAAGRGECDLCGRDYLPLTFHHLVPKETHPRWLGKALPPGLEGVDGAAPTRDFFNSHGASLCRPCHSTVHGLAPNALLATTFNTIEKLRQDPCLAGWAAFAGRLKSR